MARQRTKRRRTISIPVEEELAGLRAVLLLSDSYAERIHHGAERRSFARGLSRAPDFRGAALCLVR